MYKEGRIERILISGEENSLDGINDPECKRDSLVAHGVPVSDIIRIETLDRQTHIFISPKLIPQEEVKKISKDLRKKAQAFCEGDKERDNSQKDSHKAFSLFQEAAQMGDAEAQCSFQGRH